MTDPQQTSKAYEDIFVALQPVFDQAMTVWAYEMLFRNQRFANNAVFVDELDATMSVLAGLPLCLDVRGGDRSVVVNFPEKAIEDHLQLTYPAEKTIVQLTCDHPPDKRLLSSINDLKLGGYGFSYENFVNGPWQDALCRLADFVTLDFYKAEQSTLAALIHHCKVNYPQAALIAKRIEEYDDYEFAKSRGVDYFQGFFFKKPAVHSGKKILSTKTSKLKILKILQDEDVAFSDISKALSFDVSVVHRLLVYINSSSFGLREHIKSIEEALVILGLDPLKKWLQVIVLTDLKPKEKPHELLLLSAQRACFLELLALHNHYENIKDKLFILGLFSLIDALLEQPREHLIRQLSLDGDLEKALLGKGSAYSPWLDLVDSVETSDWAKLSTVLTNLRIDPKGISSLYKEAYGMAEAFFGPS